MIKKLLILTSLLISGSLWAETKEIYCELKGESEYDELTDGRGSSIKELKIQIEISMNKDSSGNERIASVLLRQEGIQTPFYTSRNKYSFKAEDRKIYLTYFLNPDEPHPSINLETRVYEIKAEINRYTGKAFLNGNIQGYFIDSDNDKNYITDFLDASGDCILASEKKF